MQLNPTTERTSRSAFPNAPSISANDLTKVIRENIEEFDYTWNLVKITRFLEFKTQRRIEFSSLILACLFAGFAVVPRGTTFRLVRLDGVQA